MQGYDVANDGRVALHALVAETEQMLAAVQCCSSANQQGLEQHMKKCSSKLADLQSVVTKGPVKTDTGESEKSVSQSELEELSTQRDKLVQMATERNSQIKVILDTMRQLQADIEAMQMAKPHQNMTSQ